MKELKLDIHALYPNVGDVPYDYLLLVDEVEAGQFRCESYGVGVKCRSTGESARVEDITVNAKRMETLCELLARNQVGPTHLRDVIDDWL